MLIIKYPKHTAYLILHVLRWNFSLIVLPNLISETRYNGENMPVPPQLSVQFWGVEDDVESYGFGQFVSTQLYGGNVGHASIMMTLPYNEENWTLIEGYLKETGIPYRKKHIETKRASVEAGKATQTGETAYEEDVIEVYFSSWPGLSKGFAFHTPTQDYQGEREGVDRPMDPEFAKEIELEQRVVHGLLDDRIITLSPSTIVHTSDLNADELAFIDAYQKLQVIEKSLAPWKILIEKLVSLDKETKKDYSTDLKTFQVYNFMGTTEKLLLSKLFPNENFEESQKPLEEIIADAKMQEKVLKEVRGSASDEYHKAVVQFISKKHPVSEADEAAFQKVAYLKETLDQFDDLNQVDLKERLDKLSEMGYEISTLFKQGILNKQLLDTLKKVLEQYFQPTPQSQVNIQNDKLAWTKVALIQYNQYLESFAKMRADTLDMLEELKSPNKERIEKWTNKIDEWINEVDKMHNEKLYRIILKQGLKTFKLALEKGIDIKLPQLQDLQEAIINQIAINQSDIRYQLKKLTDDNDMNYEENFGINDFLEDIVRAAATPDEQVTLPVSTKPDAPGLALEPMLQMMQAFAQRDSGAFNLVDRNCSVTTKSILAAGAGDDRRWIFEETGELMGTLFNPQSVYNSTRLYQESLTKPVTKPEPSTQEKIVSAICYPMSYAAVTAASLAKSTNRTERLGKEVNKFTKTVGDYFSTFRSKSHEEAKKPASEASNKPAVDPHEKPAVDPHDKPASVKPRTPSR